ncbi:MAG: phosphate-starvation-inducible PsiE family protein [Wenzhouxiangella sp.]|jgi:protein PsiE|nr:phosphate-starvation-inducible PsiE family protein [Wenzhouxiangella sp.]
MSEKTSSRESEHLPDAAGSVPPKSETTQSLVVDSFAAIKKALLLLTVLMTLAAVGIEILAVFERRNVTLADILLMFLYTEVIAMVAVFYTNRGSPFIYPILIAITALARLIVLQGKDMDPQLILYEAAAIVLLTVAIVLLVRFPLRTDGSLD